MNDIAPRDQLSDKLMQVMVKGDLSKLTNEEAVAYYDKVCQSIGLNPYTRPFEYIVLGGKTVLYATRNATDQLRKVYAISVEIVDQRIKEGSILVVHARASDMHGRKDEDFGAVALFDKMTPEVRANKILHAVTKAKRRVTLSICGLGWLDETEVETIPEAKPATFADDGKLPPHKFANDEPKLPPHDPETGEIKE